MSTKQDISPFGKDEPYKPNIPSGRGDRYGADQSAGEEFVDGGVRSTDSQPKPSKAKQLHEKITSVLQNVTRIDASQIKVSLAENSVILLGKVQRDEDRWIAEETVASVAGVDRVHNRLTVNEVKNPSDS